MLKHFWHNFIIHYDLYITFDELSNFSHNLPSSFRISNCSETFQLQRIFPTSKDAFQLRSGLSNFARLFPTSLGSFQPRSVLSNFARFFPTSAKLSNFRLSNLKLSNFSFFPTALSNYMHPHFSISRTMRTMSSIFF